MEPWRGSVWRVCLVASRPAAGAVQHYAIHAAIVPDCEHWTSDAKVTPLILPRLSFLTIFFSSVVSPFPRGVCSHLYLPKRILNSEARFINSLSAQSRCLCCVNDEDKVSYCTSRQCIPHSYIILAYIQTVHTTLIHNTWVHPDSAYHTHA
jgi:hypothetical protein